MPTGFSGFGGATADFGLITFGPFNFRGLGDAGGMEFWDDLGFVINPVLFDADCSLEIWRFFASSCAMPASNPAQWRAASFNSAACSQMLAPYVFWDRSSLIRM